MTYATWRGSEWVELLAHAEKLLHLVENCPPRGEFPVTPSANIHIMSMLCRARRLYAGALILLKAELPEEAAILARKLFEISLYLQELETEPQDRFALVFGWVNRSINEEFGLLKTCAPQPGLDEAFATLEKRRKENNENASELGVSFLTFLDTKIAAKKFRRSGDILIYEWAHESVHGSEAARMFATQGPAGGRVGIYAKTGNPIVLSHFAHFAAKSMVAATKATCAIFGWTLPPGLEQTVGDIEQILDSNPG
jgi:uncharacterized protein DUF5677